MNYTTIEQSKHLLELGLNPESADMYYQDILNINTDERYFEARLGNRDPTNYQVPCWTVGSLLSVIHHCAEQYTDKCTWFNLDLSKNKYACYIAEHDDYHECNSLFNMVVWLLEQGYIK